MNILEQEIEDIVWKTLTTDPELLRERGFPFNKSYSYVRQFGLGEYGRADIVGFHVTSSRIAIDIIELKREMVGFQTFMQAVRYAKGLSHMLENEGLTKRPYGFKIKIIGKSVDESSDFLYLTEIFPDVQIYTYGIDLIKGLTFRLASEYKLSNPSFPSTQKLSPILRTNLRMNYEDGKAYAIDSIPDDLPF